MATVCVTVQDAAAVRRRFGSLHGSDGLHRELLDPIRGMIARRAAAVLFTTLVMIVALLIAAPIAPAAATIRIKEPATGLTVAAPRGYSVKHASGFYTVRGGGSFASFMRTTSPLALKPTALALLAQSKGRVVGRATSTARMWRAQVRVGRRAYVLDVRTAPGGRLDISLMGPGNPPPIAARLGRTVALSPRQLVQVAALDRIIRSRRGGGIALLNIPIPMRLAQTADLMASANVPDLPGWQVDGGTGLFTVTHPNLGWGWFGMTIAAFTPQFAFARPGIDVVITPSADPGANMVQAFPQYLTQQLQMPFAFTQVQVVPGTEGILGPTIPSALYEARFTWRGIPMQGLFLWGTLNQTDVLVNSYFSGVAIADGAPGSISNALLQSWASSNGEAGFRERLSTSLENIAMRPDRQFILTPSRFRSDMSTWISLLATGAR